MKEKNIQEDGYVSTDSNMMEKEQLLMSETDRRKLEIYRKYGITDKRRTIDLLIIIFITFMGMICYSVVLPSIALYLDDFNAPGTFLGYAVAVYSVGAFISNPLFGGLADRFTTKKVLVLSIVLCFLGNAGYALCEPIKSKWLLLFARFVVGTFAGSNSVVNSHISQATTAGERTFWMTMNTIGSTLGFICGPALSLGLSAFKIKIADGININEYTSPGYLSCLISLVLIPVLLVGFRDIPEEAKIERKKEEASNQNYPKFPLFACIYLNFVNVLCLATFETVTTPFTKKLYHYGVFDNALLYTGVGVICVISFLVLVVLDKLKLDNRFLNIASIFLMYIGFVLLLRDPWLDQSRMWVGSAFIAFGYSPASALVVSIFSKVIPQNDQGIKMGLFSSIASLARIGGPILSNSVSEYFGFNRLWLMMAAVLISTCIFHQVVYNYLVPLEEVYTIDSPGMQTTNSPSTSVNIDIPKEKVIKLNQFSAGSYDSKSENFN